MEQLLSIQALTFLAGLFLIMVGSFGGGIEVKEIKIPTLPTYSRAISLAFGIVLLVLGIAFPRLFPNPQPGPVAPFDEKLKSQDAKPKGGWLGAAIENHIITISDVKRILRHLGKYSGPINDDVDDAYKQAVAEFQTSQNLAADTYVGPDTYRKLREAWPDFFETRNPGNKLPAARPRGSKRASVLGTFRTWRDVRLESVTRNKADVRRPI